MGFEVFLSCYENGGDSTFPLEVAESAFGLAIKERRLLSPQSWCWQIEYPIEQPDGFPNGTPYEFNGEQRFALLRDYSDIYISSDGENDSLTSGFMVDGPAANLQFYESLLSILQHTLTTVYCAGDCPPLVGQKATIAHLHPSMVEALGQPVLVKSAQEILDNLRGKRP